MKKQTIKIILTAVWSFTLLAIVLTWLKRPVQAFPIIKPTYWLEGELVATGSIDDHFDITAAITYITPIDSITVTTPNITYIRRYRIGMINDITPSVTATVDAINRLDSFAVAEPNWLVVASPEQYVWGSPWAAPLANIPATAFDNRWVKEMIKLEDDLQNRTITTTGVGVSVYVIDTSPFTFTTNKDSSNDVLMPNGSTMRVWHPFTVTSPMTGNPPHGGHGTMVASLVNMVAPDAKIHLFRTLNSEGYGDLFTLNKVLDRALDHAILQPETAVFNMSLGTIDNAETIGDIYSLAFLLSNAYNAGYPLVGAAGNFSTIDSSGNPVIAPMQYPAAFTHVLAVAAANSSNGRSCFSSESVDVAAPGGDGNNICQPPPNCGVDTVNCIVGWDPSATTTLFTGGQGTSYAAPLVAGQAALLLQYRQGQATVDDIYCAIKSSATYQSSERPLGYGYINISTSHTTLAQIIDSGVPTCPNISLSVYKDAPIEVAYGNLITYTLYFTNHHAQPADDVILRDAMPESATYITSSGTFNSGEVVWTIGSLQPNSSDQRTLTIQATRTVTNQDYQLWAYGGMARGQTAVRTNVWLPLQPTATLSATHTVVQWSHLSPNHIVYDLWQNPSPYFALNDPDTTLLATNTITNLIVGTPLASTHTIPSSPRYYKMQATSGLGTGVTDLSATIGSFPFTIAADTQ